MASVDSLIHPKEDFNSPESRDQEEDREWIPRCSISSKDSWNKRSLYKLLKYRTKNSHSKYKLQAIIEVIKWHFMFLPRLTPKM